jgi:hypothetical protein
VAVYSTLYTQTLFTMSLDDATLMEMKALRKDLQSLHTDFKVGIQGLTNAILQLSHHPEFIEISQQDMFATQPSQQEIIFPSDKESNATLLVTEENHCIGEVKASWNKLLNNRNQMMKKSTRNSDLGKLYDDWSSRSPPFFS